MKSIEIPLRDTDDEVSIEYFWLCLSGVCNYLFTIILLNVGHRTEFRSTTRGK